MLSLVIAQIRAVLQEARQVDVVLDKDATLKARERWSMFTELVVGRFDTSFPLYRVFDGEELARVLATGKITGGKYSAGPERSFGASWGYNITGIARGGNVQRGKRLGKDLYVAKIDALDRTFLHLSPGVDIDPSAEGDQVQQMDPERCNWALGCSVQDVSVKDVDQFFTLDDRDQLHAVTFAELKKRAT